MATPSRSRRTQLVRENRALRAHLAAAERALTVQRRSEQARVEAAVQVREREIATLYQLSEIALRDPLSSALHAVVQVVSASTGFPIVAIEYYDEPQHLMEMVAATGISTLPIPAQVPVTQTLSGVVAQSGQPVIETQALDRPEYAYAPLRQLGIQTFVCVPMRIHERVIGTLALAHPEAVPLDAHFVPWVRSLANFLALMVDRAHVEEQIASAAWQSQAILEKLAGGVLLIDPEGRYTFANARAAAMFGLTPDTLVGKSLADVLPSEIAQTYLERNRRIIATNAAEEYEVSFTLPAGERTFFIADQVLTDAQGVGYALLTNSIDVTARVRAEAALRESEAKLRVLFELLPVGVSILNVERRIVFTNPALQQILDMPYAQLVTGAYHTRRYLRPDGTPMPAAEFASIRAFTEKRAIYDVETGVVKEGGEVVWTSVSAVPVTFQDWHVIVVTTDITERKRAEDALRMSRQNLESLIENTDGSIWSVDAEYQLIVGNRLYHRNVSAALGRSLAPGEHVLTPALPQAALDEWQAYYDQAMRHGPFSIETSTRFTVTPHTVEYRLSPITSVTGQVMGVTVFGRDITARKQMEEALRTSEARYRLISEHSADVIWTLDVATFRFTYVSPSVQRLRGYTADEVMAQPVAAALTPESQQHIATYLRTFIAAIEAGDESARSTTTEVAQPCKDGTIIQTEVVTTLLTDAQGRVTTVLGVSRDITARKQAEATLRQAMEALIGANADLERQTRELQASETRVRDMLQEKDVLLKEIHHRVKNNLQVVMSLLRLQSRQVTDAQALAALRDSRQRVEVMTLVHELLYRTSDLAAINAALYFQQLGTRISQVYEATTGHVTISVTADGICLNLDQAVPCGLIISELLANSLKYAFPDGQPGEIGIDLRATDPGRLTLTIWDRGVGIAPNAAVAQPPSLGMTLVHDLVRQLRGSIVIVSRAGVTVTITFPRGAASV